MPFWSNAYAFGVLSATASSNIAVAVDAAVDSVAAAHRTLCFCRRGGRRRAFAALISFSFPSELMLTPANLKNASPNIQQPPGFYISDRE